MDDGNLIKLKNSKLALLKSLAIDKLKHEREQLNDLYLREKEGIFHFEKEMEELREQEEFLQSSIQEKEESTAEIEQMILESENAYNTVIIRLNIAID